MSGPLSREDCDMYFYDPDAEKEAKAAREKKRRHIYEDDAVIYENWENLNGVNHDE